MALDEARLEEFVGQSFGNQMDRQSRRVGGYNRPGLPKLRDFREQSALNLEVFSNNFNDPVRIGNPRQIILEISD